MPVEQPFFSIVMPIYNVEKFLPDSLADVLTQTFRDFEVVAVDDASTDASANVVRAVCAGDGRVRLMRHPYNRGVSAARNTGIGLARGTWVLFLDPDDRFQPNLLQVVYDRIMADPKLDLVVYNHTQRYYDVDGSLLYVTPMKLAQRRYEGVQQLASAVLSLESGTHLGYPWNKAYRLEIIKRNKIQFEEDVPFIEDILFNLRYMRYVRALQTIPNIEVLYGKKLGKNLTNQADVRYFEMHRRRIQELRDLLYEWGCLDEHARSVLGALYARYILSALERNCSKEYDLTRREQLGWLEAVYQEPLYDELIPFAQAQDSAALALCLQPLKRKESVILLWIGRMIHFVRTRSTTLYSRAKSGR